MSLSSHVLRSLSLMLGKDADYHALLAKNIELSDKIDADQKRHESLLGQALEDRDIWRSKYEQLEFAAHYLTSEMEKDIPAFKDQTPWQSDYIHLNPPPGTCYFNPTITRFQGKLLLFARRNRDRATPKEYNDIVCFELDDALRPSAMRVIDLPANIPREHFEDPRVVAVGDNLWLSVCTFSTPPQTFSHQAFFMLDRNLQCRLRCDPVFGDNMEQASVNEGHEKNWLFFPYAGSPHCVYMSNPFRVLKFDGRLNVVEEYTTDDFNPMWKHGEPRGGTPPVLVDGEYWTFFHSSLPWTETKRRYHMGAMAFKTEPPFGITRCTTLPLLSGSIKDTWYPPMPLVIFPGGAVFDEHRREWTVVFGVNDICCGYIRIPHADLKPLCRASIDNEIELVPEVVEGLDAKPDDSNHQPGGAKRKRRGRPKKAAGTAGMPAVAEVVG